MVLEAGGTLVEDVQAAAQLRHSESLYILVAGSAPADASLLAVSLRPLPPLPIPGQVTALCVLTWRENLVCTSRINECGLVAGSVQGGDGGAPGVARAVRVAHAAAGDCSIRV